MKKSLSLFLFLFVIFCVYPFNILAKEKELSSSQEWVKESYQPVIEETIKNLEKSWHSNWTLNLAYFMEDNDKGKALESLDVLKEDIKKLRNDVKSIELDESLHKKEMKEVKKVKKRLDKVLKAHLNQSYKVSKHIRKDKNVSSTKKYDNKVNKSQKHIEKANKHHANLIESVDVNVDSFELNKTKLIDDKSSKEILKAEELRLEEVQAKKDADEERKKKESKKLKQQEEEKLKELEKIKVKKREEFNEQIDGFIELGQGVIHDIKPNDLDDWEVAYVYVDNSWYDLNEGDKLSFAEKVGPVIESTIIEYGMNDYSTVYIVDENKTIVASPKLFGGYKIK